MSIAKTGQEADARLAGGWAYSPESLIAHILVSSGSFQLRDLTYIRKKFKGFRNFWHAKDSALRKSAEPPWISALASLREASYFGKERADLSREDIRLVACGEPGYPPLLEKIYLPPAVIYYRGVLPSLNSFGLAPINEVGIDVFSSVIHAKPTRLLPEFPIQESHIDFDFTCGFVFSIQK